MTDVTLTKTQQHVILGVLLLGILIWAGTQVAKLKISQPSYNPDPIAIDLAEPFKGDEYKFKRITHINKSLFPSGELVAKKKNVRNKAQATKSLNLEMVAIQGTNREASINGYFYKEGSTLGKYYHVRKITELYVVLVDPRGKIRILRMY